jgi:predicted ferric reductase
MTAWHVNRAAGLVALALLTASIALGLLVSSRLLGRRVRGSWLTDLHRGVSALACAFVGVHVLAVLADPWLDAGPADVLIPFASSWRPGAVTWGIVSMYLLAAVQLTSLLRKHLSPELWRRFHLLSYPLWLTAAFHGLSAGTTLSTPAGDVALALAAATIAGLTAIRVLEPHGRRTRPASPDPAPASIPASVPVTVPAGPRADRPPQAWHPAPPQTPGRPGQPF